jgi:hypothetical protein
MIYTFFDIKKRRITVKESFWWSLILILMLILAIFPYSIDIIAGWLGISYSPTLLLIGCSVFLLLMNYRNSKYISDLTRKVTELEQAIAIDRNKNSKTKKKD